MSVSPQLTINNSQTNKQTKTVETRLTWQAPRMAHSYDSRMQLGQQTVLKEKNTMETKNVDSGNTSLAYQEFSLEVFFFFFCTEQQAKLVAWPD